MLKCKICGEIKQQLGCHLKYKHKMTASEYKTIYGECQIVSDELCKRLSDNVSSIWKIDYWIKKGYTEIESKNKIKELQQSNSKKNIENWKSENTIWNYKHWIGKGMTEEQAKQKVYEIQSKLSARSSKFKGKIRSEESKKKISESMVKKINLIGKTNWASHFGEFDGRSKVEVECYNYIKENIDKDVLANVPIGDYIVDVIKDKKIIEFNGDFWHANPNFYNKEETLKGFNREVRLVENIWKKDYIRSCNICKMGYTILIIWEYDWNNNKEDCVKRIKEYLYD